MSASHVRTRQLTIIAQDPNVLDKDGNILTAKVEIPAETLAPGPRGYRAHIIDYDASTGTLYKEMVYDPPAEGGLYEDPFHAILADKQTPAEFNEALLNNPQFHAQNVYAIVMRTLARFEFALGRRVSWSFDGHQIHVAPHAFAEANAFYSEADRALLFGYFRPAAKKPVVFSCLSHDVVAHETTHALLDGLRTRYTDPSSVEQAAFHEGFADIVALLSVFSLRSVVALLLGKSNGQAPSDDLVAAQDLTIENLKESALMGLAEQMGEEMSGARGEALRRSAKLSPPRGGYANKAEFEEPHRRGELFVAAMMNAFLKVWRTRIERLLRGRQDDSWLDRGLVAEAGSDAAEQLLTMSIRALDYLQPTDINFGDYLSALLTADKEAVPDDSKYGYRQLLKESFALYGIKPPTRTGSEGTWAAIDPLQQQLSYDRSHFDSLLRDKDEVFRFLWDNREVLKIDEKAYTEVQSVRSCLRIGPDGFALRETVAEYVQMVNLRADEVDAMEGLSLPAKDLPDNIEFRLYGSGSLIFDEYGRLKYHISNRLYNGRRQSERLKFLSRFGFLGNHDYKQNLFARLHLRKAGGMPGTLKEDW